MKRSNIFFLIFYSYVNIVYSASCRYASKICIYIYIPTNISCFYNPICWVNWYIFHNGIVMIASSDCLFFKWPIVLCLSAFTRMLPIWLRHSQIDGNEMLPCHSFFFPFIFCLCLWLSYVCFYWRCCHINEKRKWEIEPKKKQGKAYADDEQKHETRKIEVF